MNYPDPPRKPSAGSPSALREFNRNRVLAHLREHGKLAQIDLARQTGLAPATVSNIVRELVADRELVVEHDAGRRRVVRVAERTGYVVGVDCGHAHTTVAISDLAHQVLAEHRIDSPGLLPAQERLSRAADVLAAVLAEAGVDRSQVVGAGLGLPAPIDQTTGRVGSPTILPGWVGLRPAEVAESTLDLPVPIAVDNDANLGALAEWKWGAGVGTTNLVYLKVADGVGAGLIIDNRLYSGASGTAGEIGHTTVDEFGEVCRCGNRGCLETFISGQRLIALLANTHGADLTLTDIIRQAEGGDRACTRVLEDAGRQIGRALADVVSVLNPEMIVLGGELAQATPLMVPVIRQFVQRCGVPSAAESLEIRSASLGGRAHVLGALALGLRQADVHEMNGHIK